MLAHHKRSRTIAKHVVGDYGYRCKYQTPVYSAAQISYHKLTLSPDGVSFDASGTLPVPSGPQNEFIEPELHDRAHAAGLKVLLLLGGDFGGK